MKVPVMASDDKTNTKIPLGDPVPWFSARTVTGAAIDLHVAAGRWIVLAFLGSPASPRAAEELAALLGEAHRLDEDRIVAYGIWAAPPGDLARLAAISTGALAFILDEDGAIAKAYGAAQSPRTIVLDPMLRAVANIAWDDPQGHAQILARVLASLPTVDELAGVPLTAPALIVPRVLDFGFCDLLVQLYDKVGGEDSGFLVDHDGKTATIVNHAMKQRRDMIIAVPELRDAIRGQVIRRLLPAVERYFQFAATRMDRYMVSCYDSAIGGHFHRHRDNVNAGAQHRRFAVSINLNRDYDGCDLIFPEFGRRSYRAPVGGAVVFSCGALHEVTPITRGRRYALIPFLYGESDAALREANNRRLHDDEPRYLGDNDRLFPALAAE